MSLYDYEADAWDLTPRWFRRIVCRVFGHQEVCGGNLTPYCPDCGNPRCCRCTNISGPKARLLK